MQKRKILLEMLEYGNSTSLHKWIHKDIDERKGDKDFRIQIPDKKNPTLKF